MMAAFGRGLNCVDNRCFSVNGSEKYNLTLGFCNYRETSCATVFGFAFDRTNKKF
jgi:hypothetical protein